MEIGKVIEIGDREVEIPKIEPRNEPAPVKPEKIPEHEKEDA